MKDSISIRGILLEFAYTPMGETETPDTSKAEAQLLQLLESKAYPYMIADERQTDGLNVVRAIPLSALRELK